MQSKPLSIALIAVVGLVLYGCAPPGPEQSQEQDAAPQAPPQEQPVAQPPEQPREPTRVISNITGDLYRTQDDFHYGVFLVTSEGIILADPISTDFAQWLKAELAERFDVPVKYVIYSHYHGDHNSGGAVFSDTAEIIAHENTPISLARGADDDGLRDVQPPDTTYSDRTTVTLGGKTVELIHSVPSHSDDSTLVVFPEERVVFAVDFVGVNRLPFRNMGGGPVGPWLVATEHLQATVDYDTLAAGHGDMGSKADVDDYQRYLEDLLGAVTEGVTAGKSLEELQQSIVLEEYQDWAGYGDWLAGNIEAAYNGLTANQ